MARILVAFFNGLKDQDDSNVMPIFYEAFVSGLEQAGNEVAVISHRMFVGDFPELDEENRRTITRFEPDICFVFNNNFYDLSDVVSCPIVIYEVDSPIYFSNKKKIRENPDRYLYFMIQMDNKKVLMKEYGVSEKQIFYVPQFSEVYADERVKPATNISFIGSRFLTSDIGSVQRFIGGNPSREDWEIFQRCINEIRVNPQISTTDLVYKCQVTSELVARNLNIPEILMVLSGEKRLKVLSAVADLGLDLYGTQDWGAEYYYDLALNFSYINEKVYSIAHNQMILNQSRLGINVSHLQATSGFPWRVMDIMASNACLVTDYHSAFERLFPEISEILPTYENPSEAYNVCKQLLSDEARRRDVVLRCNEIVERNYRFRNLLLKMEQYSGIKMHVDIEDKI